jgi:hypothetical protein
MNGNGGAEALGVDGKGSPKMNVELLPPGIIGLGLAATAFGAWIAGRGALITKAEARSYGGAVWADSPFEKMPLAQALYRQGQAKKRGLMWGRGWHPFTDRGIDCEPLYLGVAENCHTAPPARLSSGPEATAKAQELRRKRGKRRRLSLRVIARELAAAGHVNSAGKAFGPSTAREMLAAR